MYSNVHIRKVNFKLFFFLNKRRFYICRVWEFWHRQESLLFRRTSLRMRRLLQNILIRPPWVCSGSALLVYFTWSWLSRSYYWYLFWNQQRKLCMYSTDSFMGCGHGLVHVRVCTLKISHFYHRWKRILNLPLFGAIQTAWTTLFYAALLILIVLFAG